MRIHHQESSARFPDRVSLAGGRQLTTSSTDNIVFAFQVLLGTIDSTVIHQLGPVLVRQRQFIERLTRTCTPVLEFDSQLTTEAEQTAR